MGNLYPHTVNFFRPPEQSGEGALAYGGRTAASEIPVTGPHRANVQHKRDGQKPPVGLPADNKASMWQIFLPRGAVAPGVIKDRDIAVDNLGRRFAVTADYSHNLGWRISAERLES